jgi:hypothetical protein
MPWAAAACSGAFAAMAPLACVESPEHAPHETAAQAVVSLERLPEWRLRPLRVIDSGQAPEQGFAFIVDATDDARGRLLVLDRAQSSVWVFDSVGQFVRSIGRRGRGPGELLEPIRVSAIADTIYVSDPNQARMQLFDADGRAIRSLSAFPAGRAPSWTERTPAHAAAPWIVGVTRAGWLVRNAPATTSGLEDTRGTRTPVSLEDPATRRLVTIGDHESGRKWRVIRSDGMPIEVNQPFLGRDSYFVDRGGTGVLFVEQSHDSLVRSATFLLRRVGPRGEVEFQRRYEVPARRVPASAANTVYERFFGRFPDLRRAAMDSLVRPSHLPAVRSGWIGRDGTLWLGSGIIGSTDWIVLRPNGDPMGRLTLPDSVRLLAADSMGVWLAAYNSDDVPAFMRSLVERPAATH